MAIVAPVITPVVGQTNIDGWQVIWGPLHNGDVGAAVGTTIGYGASSQQAPGGGLLSGFADKTVQVVGTFGAGGTATIQGSNDAGANWFTLNDPFNNQLTLSTAVLKEITEAIIWIRPSITAGDGTTNLTVTMFLRKTATP